MGRLQGARASSRSAMENVRHRRRHGPRCGLVQNNQMDSEEYGPEAGICVKRHGKARKLMPPAALPRTVHPQVLVVGVSVGDEHIHLRVFRSSSASPSATLRN